VRTASIIALILRRVFWCKFTDVSEVFTLPTIGVMALMVEILCMSETSVNSYQNKLHNIPDENHLKNLLIIKFLTQQIPMIK
jgi:hypothetical protein